jgi:chaperonin GroEL (HSP60 family)
MLRALCRSLSSKVVSQYSSIFAPMAVDAVLHILDQKRADLLDLKDIRVVSKVGGTIDDSELVDGMIFSQKACKAAGGPTRIEKAKIGLIQVPHQLLMFRHPVTFYEDSKAHEPTNIWRDRPEVSSQTFLASGL